MITLNDLLKSNKNFGLDPVSISETFDDFKREVKKIRNQRAEICNTCQNRCGLGLANYFRNNINIPINTVKEANAVGRQNIDFPQALERLASVQANRMLEVTEKKKNQIKQMIIFDWKKIKAGENRIDRLIIFIFLKLGMHYNSVNLLIDESSAIVTDDANESNKLLVFDFVDDIFDIILLINRFSVKKYKFAAFIIKSSFDNF